MNQSKVGETLFLLFGGMIVLATGCQDGGLSDAELMQQPVAERPAKPGEPQVPHSGGLRDLIDETARSVDSADPDDAIEKYSDVLRREKFGTVYTDDSHALRARVFQMRGQAFLEKGFPLIAIQDFDDAIRFGNASVKAKTFVMRARADSTLKRWPQAVADCSRSIRLDPDNGEAFLVRARALEALGQPGHAERSYEEAERLGVVRHTTFKPSLESAPTSMARARISLDSGLPGVAREILKRAILDGNDSWETSGLLAVAHFQMQDFQRAIAVSTRAIELNPQYGEGYRVRGLANLKEGHFDKAVIDLKAATVLDPSLKKAIDPKLAEARKMGGVDPLVRASVARKITSQVADLGLKQVDPGPTETWLLELIAKRTTSEQVNHLRSLLAATKPADYESLQWLEDFLLVEYRFVASREIRTYLQQKSLDENAVIEKSLWEAIETAESAVEQDVNVFRNLAEYSTEYEFWSLLKKSIETSGAAIKFDHVYRAMEKEDVNGLCLVLPEANLLSKEVRSLLDYCVKHDRKQHALLILDRYKRALNWQLIEFLGLAESTAQ